MKGFFNIFSESAARMKELRTLAVTGMLMAMGIALRSAGIDVTPDLRIVFTCLPLCVIGMFYGPVVCAFAALGIDVIGYIIANRTSRGYMPQLIPVELLTGVIYGVVLYKRVIRPRRSDIFRAAIARGLAVVICNICLRSYILYTSFTAPDFTLMCFVNGDNAMRDAFLLWITPRVVKNAVQYFVDILLLSAILPAAQTAYGRVFGRRKARG
ncbi:MAG: folate family ECF transporter S component [Ruminococcus sp.]|nr:folate family ECF transporter S component [Ruminococcus sp.]